MILINNFNYMWYVPLHMAEMLGMKMPSMQDNWLSLKDIMNLLHLTDFEILYADRIIPLPIKHLPFFQKINDFIAHMPFFRHFGLMNFLIAKPAPDTEARDVSCSIIIPTRNEAGNIESAVKRMPKLSSALELIFVDGASTDGTVGEIERMQALYKDKITIKLIHQKPTQEDKGSDKMLKAGKGDAVRKGFDAAEGDILLILDSDLTVAPEDLPKFYMALSEKRAQFVNGSRLVYPLEQDSMRFLNSLANKFFGLLFSWILNQPIKDTLCGTKGLFKKDYEVIKKNRSYFGDFDPFGDFDLLFGAARSKLRIVDIPVRYHRRVYGDIKIERFRHGLLLLKMSCIGIVKLKFGMGRKPSS